jgi:SAM-dependent methyltransferase
MKKVLYINHKAQKCGVYEFGNAIGNAITKSSEFNIRYEECDSFKDLQKVYNVFKPDIIIYNYHPQTMPWISKPIIRGIYSIYKFRSIQIGTIHEVYQRFADVADNKIFDYHVCADPTLLLKNPIVFKTGRLIPSYLNKNIKKNLLPTIGSFGFAVGAKQFIQIVEQVQKEYDEAIININISFAKYGDENGNKALKITEEIQKAVKKEKVKLNITNNHFSKPELLDFLNNNDLNVFFYKKEENRGISSATDWALAVDKPIAINKSMMFRHLFEVFPSICIEDNSFNNIINEGTNCLKKIKIDWTEENIIWDYNRIIRTVLNKSKTKKINKIKQTLKNKIKSKIKPNIIVSPWLKKDDNLSFNGFLNIHYNPIDLSKSKLNRILDNSARELYGPAIDLITKIAPEIMKNKISEANVQQGFVFDTAYRFAIAKKNQIKILVVGAFEDTSSIALKKLGFSVDELDPVINYDLNTYLTKPSIKPESYDIIISTSVIEHVEDDEKFIMGISTLLKKEGIAILTCDFHNDYRVGFDIPSVDFRFYTKLDLTERLMNIIPNCLHIDKPDYDCDFYDFTLNNRFNYTFATLVFIKK